MDLKNRLLEAKRKIFRNAYSYLNDKQKEAVFSTEGPLLVLAGAGSGKTTVLVQRIAFILKYGNAYFCDDVPEEMLMEAFVEKLEETAKDPDNKEMTEGAMKLFARPEAYPYQILAITFTNKAANEIKSRLESALGESALDIWAGTFHSVCARLLRMHIDRLGFDTSFTIYDTDDQKRLMKSIMNELSVNDKTFPVKSVLSQISSAKEKLEDCKTYEANVGQHDIRRKTVARLYKEYEKRKRAANALDFDDLILLTVKLLEEDGEIREKYRRRFKYVLVDEYQDTNKAQFRLTELLCNENNNIMVVGDDDQSIYKFRGATIDNILGFDNHFKDTKVVKLEQNYRSSSMIVGAANSVIANNKGRKGKTLWTGNAEGDPITVKNCENQNSEAQYIVNKISDLVADGSHKFEDFAILYRMNAQSNSLETAFAKSGIPYRIIGGLRFYERMEIKDVIAYLCALANPGDSLRLKRIINTPKRGIGDATVEALEMISIDEGKNMLEVAKNASAYPALSRSASKLTKFADMMYELRNGYEQLSIGVLVEKVLAKTGYMEYLAELDKAEAKDRTANVKELVSNAVQYENTTPDATLASFLEEVALVADIDNYDKDANAVVMMTVHSAKGLEFPVVFLPGMEEGVFPGNQTIAEADEEMEEERRLAYVAITRAMKKLYIIHCRNRMVFGRTEFHEKSRFVSEIDEKFCEFEVNDIDRTYAKEEYSGYGFERAYDKQESSDYTWARGAASPSKVTTGFAVPQRKDDAYAYNKAREASARNKQKAQATAAANHFKIGDRVEHPVFKTGTVLGAKPMGADVLYEVAFDSVGTKKIMGNFAKMKKV